MDSVVYSLNSIQSSCSILLMLVCTFVLPCFFFFHVKYSVFPQPAECIMTCDMAEYLLQDSEVDSSLSGEKHRERHCV